MIVHERDDHPEFIPTIVWPRNDILWQRAWRGLIWPTACNEDPSEGQQITRFTFRLLATDDSMGFIMEDEDEFQ